MGGGVIPEERLHSTPVTYAHQFLKPTLEGSEDQRGYDSCLRLHNYFRAQRKCPGADVDTVALPVTQSHEV